MKLQLVSNTGIFVLPKKPSYASYRGHRTIDFDEMVAFLFTHPQ